MLTGGLKYFNQGRFCPLSFNFCPWGRTNKREGSHLKQGCLLVLVSAPLQIHLHKTNKKIIQIISFDFIWNEYDMAYINFRGLHCNTRPKQCTCYPSKVIARYLLFLIFTIISLLIPFISLSIVIVVALSCYKGDSNNFFFTFCYHL